MISFTDDQRLLAAAVRDALAKSCPPEAVRAARIDPAARRGEPWRALAALGLLGAHVPEEHGGLGLTPMDTVLAFEEIGRAAAPGPIVETAVAAPVLLRAAGREEAAGWLPKIADGRAAVSVRTEDVPFLLDADIADLLIVQCGDRAAMTVTPMTVTPLTVTPLTVTAMTVPEAVTLTPRPSADPARRLFEDDLDVAAGRHAGVPTGAFEHAFRRAFDHAALAVAAQLLGAARHLLDAAVAYAKQRHQFGRPIGSFQAVKHQLADVAVAVEFAAPTVYGAAAALTETAPAEAMLEAVLARDLSGGVPTGGVSTSDLSTSGGSTSDPSTSDLSTSGVLTSDQLTSGVLTSDRLTSGVLAGDRLAGGAPTVSRDVSAASRDVSAAKVAAAAAAHRAARTALQVHGAIGYTEELDLHLWLARVWALRTAWGDDRLHRARLRRALLGPARGR